MHRATAELIASGAARQALKIGDKAPAFTLKDPDGNDVSSTVLLAQGPLVVSFYRGVWCPYCNMELQALQAALPEFQRRGARLVAISPQTAPNSRKSVRQNALAFPILSDPENSVAGAFGLRFALPDYLVELYKALKNDLPNFNGDPSWTLPMPGPLRDRAGRHDPLCRGQSRLYPPPRARRHAAGARSVRRRSLTPRQTNPAMAGAGATPRCWRRPAAASPPRQNRRRCVPWWSPSAQPGRRPTDPSAASPNPAAPP
ncbi:MAG: peroxiredoxin-like family protein [Aliidongia sp.]